MKKSLTLLTAALFCTAPLTYGADIVRNGKAQVSFVLPRESSLKRIPFLQSRLAAKEITDYVKKISGADLATAKDVPGKIFLLAGKDAEKILKGRKMHPEGFVIVSTAKDITIASPSMIGVLYGAYTLLEKYADVHWLFPGKEGEYYPKRSTITVPVGEFVSNPSFTERYMCPTGGNAFAGMYGAKNTWQWLSRNKVKFTVFERSPGNPKLLPGDEFLFSLGGWLQKGGHETFYRSVPDSLLKTHPEYFCLVNGERLPQHHPSVKLGGCTYAQVCTSHPEVNSLIADFVMKTLQRGIDKSYPTSFLYGAGDNCSTWCHCPTCEKLFNNYAPDRFYYMVNQSAAKVFKKYPDADLCSWIYADFRRLPKKIVPDKRLHYTFCDHGRCYTHELRDPSCPINRKMLQLMNDWEKLVGPMKIYEYYCVGQPYAPHEVIAARDLKYYYQRKWSGYTDEISAPDAYYLPRARKGKGGVPIEEIWTARWQQIYLVSKLLWDIHADVTKTLDEANRLYYGPAFPAMKPYRELLGKLWTGVSVHFVYGTGGVPCPGAYAMLLPDADKLEKYLAQAEKLAAGKEPYAGRIRREKRFLKVAWLDPAKELKNNKASGIIKPVTDKITVDGRLAESTWRNASPLGEFRKNKDTPAKFKTFVKAAYDDSNLYVAFTCMDDNVSRTTCDGKKHDDEIFYDNDVEMMINPTGKPGNYYYIAVNSNGVSMDMQLKNGVWDKKYTCNGIFKAVREKDRWILEGAIPLSSLGGNIMPGSMWKINFCRNRKAFGLEGEISSIANGVFQGGFQTFQMGESPLVNGSMNDVVPVKNRGRWKAPSGMIPKHWSWGQSHSSDGGTVGEAILRDPIAGEYELHLAKGAMYQIILYPAKFDRKLKFSLKAYGSGELFVDFYLYRKVRINDTKTQVKYVGSKRAAKFKLTNDKTLYTGEYVLKAGDQCGVALETFHEAFVDDFALQVVK